MKYIKKPIEIEALQWTGNNDLELMNFIPKDIANYEIIDTAYEVGKGPPHIVGITIKTLEGEMKANRGDYIIKGIKGEFYPCKAEIFEESYVKISKIKKTSILDVLNCYGEIYG